MDLYVKVSPSISSMIGLNTIERYIFLNGFCVCHGEAGHNTTINYNKNIKFVFIKIICFSTIFPYFLKAGKF